MTEHDTTPDVAGPTGAWGRLAAWQRTLLVCSIVLTFAGGGLMAFAHFSAPPAPVASSPAGGDLGPGVTGFLPGETGGDGAGGPEGGEGSVETRTIDEVSPAVFRLGFSFFIGFALAYAMRQFLKLALIILGLQVFIIAGLQYVGFVEVNWVEMEGFYDRSVTWIGDQTAGFQAFLTGYLPSTASAVAGLAIGFKRK
jgi:uncharacterized membrane protein (Fun14 family)